MWTLPISVARRESGPTAEGERKQMRRDIRIHFSRRKELNTDGRSALIPEENGVINY
jgi:hypothetical protein